MSQYHTNKSGHKLYNEKAAQIKSKHSYSRWCHPGPGQRGGPSDGTPHLSAHAPDGY